MELPAETLKGKTNASRTTGNGETTSFNRQENDLSITIISSDDSQGTRLASTPSSPIHSFSQEVHGVSDILVEFIDVSKGLGQALPEVLRIAKITRRRVNTLEDQMAAVLRGEEATSQRFHVLQTAHEALTHRLEFFEQAQAARLVPAALLKFKVEGHTVNRYEGRMSLRLVESLGRVN